MRCAPLIVPLALFALSLAAEDPAAANGAPHVPAAAPDKDEIAKADQQAKAGLEAMQASNADTSRTVDAALAFSSALQIYEAAGDNEKAREMQANIFWCKKRMNLDDLERFVASKGKDPQVAASLARIEQVVAKKIPTEQADAYLADADRYALENPDQGFLIAVRYFEVAERFLGTPASLKAQRKSLDFQAKAAPAAAGAAEADTLFTRPVKPPQGRQPVPAAAEQKLAKDAVRKLYKDDFSARLGNAAKSAFAWRLFDQAKSTKDDPKMRHALLVEATQLAVLARDVAGILAFSDELANGFDGIDAVEEKKAQLTKIKTDTNAAAVLKLLDDPRDPAANAVAGKYFCLTAGKWDVGLPLLALGNDPVLAKLANMEAAKPTVAAQQMELGDAWFAQGSARTDQGGVAWNRAAHWYRKALPSLTGVSKERVEQSIEDMFPAVIDAKFKWDKITEKQWEKIRVTPLTIAGNRRSTDTGLVLRAGQRVRIVPHPTDTWMYQTPWSGGAEALTWRGGRVSYFGDRFTMGSMVAWVQEGQLQAPGVITGPGRLVIGAMRGNYVQKGGIRVKILEVEDD